MRALWMIFALTIFPSFAHAGPGDTGGGDELSMEFDASLRTAVEFMRVSGKSEFAPIVGLDWEKILKNTRKLTVDRRLFVTRDGAKQECVAINHRSKRLIEINRARWKNLPSPRLKEGIALHEVLSLLGLEETGLYHFSGQYLALFGHNPDPYLGEPSGIVPLPQKISRVYPYRCRRRFVEGEGVSPYSIQCVAGQKLGFLSADYHFYVFSGPTRNNLSERMREQNFPGPICGLENVNKIYCENPSEPEFGLAEAMEGVFTVAITMTSSPSNFATTTYGYAAMPNSRGECPRNLVKARPYLAQPPSVIDPLPSNFINSNNTLNNTLVTTKAPLPFEIWRQPNSQPCDANGICSWPQGESVLSHSVSYVAMSPVVCVIPRQSLSSAQKEQK